MTKIIGIGNALVDVLVHLEDETHLNRLQLPKGGMTHVDRPRYEELAAAVSTLPHKVATGGSAANAIHAMALLGDTVGFVGTVGADTMGTLFATCSRERGIDARLRVCDEGDTGVATTFITEDGERTFATYLGVAPQIEFQPDPDFIGDDAILHVEGYLVQDHDFIEHVMRTAKEAGMRVSYDLASWNIVRADHDFVEHLVQDYVDIVFANEEEAAAFSGQDDPEVSLRQFAAMTEVAVVKVGRRGAMGQRGQQRADVAGLAVNAVDTTAAGDTFTGFFIGGLAEGRPLAECMRRASMASAISVTRMGAAVSIPKVEEVESRLAEL